MDGWGPRVQIKTDTQLMDGWGPRVQIKTDTQTDTQKTHAERESTHTVVDGVGLTEREADDWLVQRALAGQSHDREHRATH